MKKEDHSCFTSITGKHAIKKEISVIKKFNDVKNMKIMFSKYVVRCFEMCF